MTWYCFGLLMLPISTGWVKVSLYGQYRSWPRIENVRASVTSQVLDSVLLNGLGLDTQIGPAPHGLSIDASLAGVGKRRSTPASRAGLALGSLKGINSKVVDVLALNLVRADGRPPHGAVEDVGKKHSDRLGEDRCARDGLERQGGHECFERGVGVHSRTGQAEGLTDRSDGGSKHDCQCLSDIHDVGRQDLGGTVVELVKNGVFYQISLLQAVKSSLTSDSVQQPVLGTEKSSRSDNGGIGESLADSLLTGVL